MPIRYFTTYKDLLEMRVGDQILRVLPQGIDDKITFGCNGCAIAVDIWEDRDKSKMSVKPMVLSSGSKRDVVVYPESGVRYSFDFYNNCVTQITELSDLGERVAGLNYGLVLMSIESTLEERDQEKKKATNKKIRAAKARVYDAAVKAWIQSGREGPEPKKPSHMMTRSHRTPERLRVLEDHHPDGAGLSVCDLSAHEKLRQRRRERRGL